MDNKKSSVGRNGTQVAIFDFDGTLTRTDTIKFLILSLSVARPIAFLRVFPLLVLFIVHRLDIQTCKTRMIGTLINGLKREHVSRKLHLYKALTNIFVNKQMIDRLRSLKGDGYHIIVATASPDFAVNCIEWLAGCEILGTEYACHNGRYLSRLQKKECLGQYKADALSRWLAMHPDFFFSYAYSDSETDIPMLELAEKSFLVASKETIKPFAKRL